MDSPSAAEELMEAIQSGANTEELEGQTDCPQGCTVAPDETCPHGFDSAALSAGVI